MALYRDPEEAIRRLAAGELPQSDRVEAPPAYDPEALRREGLLRRYEQQSESGRALQQGAENVRASLQGARGLARILTGDEDTGLDDLRLAQRTQAEAGEFGPQVQSLEDIDGIGSGAAYVRNLALQQAPNLAVAAGTGLAGGLARLGVGAAVRGAGEAALARGVAARVAERTGEDTVRRELVKRAGRRIAKQASARVSPGATAKAFEQGAEAGGAAAGSVLQAAMAPEIVLDPNAQGTTQEKAAAAAIGSVATGALEALPVTALLRRYGLGQAEQALKGSVLSRIGQAAAKQGTTEAITEVAQQAGERAAHKYVNDNVDLLGPEAYSEYLNAAAGGFVGGAAFGAPAGLRGAKSDSPAGKRYTESFRGFMGRFKRPGQPEGGPTPPAPAGEPFDLKQTVAKAADFGKKVATQAESFVREKAPEVTATIKGLDGKLRNVAAQFQSAKDDLSGQTDTSQSVTELLDALPFEGYDSNIGTRTFNGGEGIGPAMDLIPDTARPGQIARDLGIPLREAVAASMIDDLTTRRELIQSGALAEAAKALTGVDPADLDSDKITAFQDALGPEGSQRRSAFNRTAHTAWALTRDDRQPIVPPSASARNEPTRSQKEAGVVDEERPLLDTAKAVKAWRSKAGKPLGKAPAPVNAVVVKDRRGARRALTGQQIGRMLIDAREDHPELASQPTTVQVASVLAGFAEQGLSLDPSSLRALRLGKDWNLTEADAAKLAQGMTPTRQGQTPADFPSFKGRSAPADLNAEYGSGDYVDVQRDEVEGQRTQRGALQPLQTGSPRTDTRVIGGERPRSDVRSREYAAAERTAVEARDRLDRYIATALVSENGPQVSEINAKNRRTLFLKAANTEFAKRNPSLRSALKEAGAAYFGAEEERAKAARKRKPKQVEAPAMHVQEGQTEDAGEVDTEAAKEERRLYAPDAFNEIDQLLERHTKQQVNGDFALRRELYTQAYAKAGPRGKAELRDAAARYGEAQYQSALKAWQKNKTPKTRARLERARAAAERGGSGVLPSKIVMQRDANPLLAKRAQVKETKKTGTSDVREKKFTPLQEGDTSNAPNADDATVQEFMDLTRTTSAVEKTSDPAGWTAEERAAYDSGDWRRFSELRGYSKKEIADFARWMELVGRLSKVYGEDNVRALSAYVDLGRVKTLAQARETLEWIEFSPDHAATSTATGVAAEIKALAGTRSKAALIALKNKVANSTFAPEVKQKLYAKIDEARAKLHDAASAAGSRQFLNTNVHNRTAEHFNRFTAAIKGAANLEAGLKAVREMATPDQKRLIDTLLGMRALRGVVLNVVERDGAGLVSGEHSAPQAEASSLNSTVTMRVSPEAGTQGTVDGVYILLHEAIHAATTNSERTDPVARRAVADMLAHAREQATKLGVDPDVFYGLSETQEFLAEAFTNPELQGLLRQMPARNTEKFQSLWDEFKDFVRRLLGLGDKDATLLDEVFTVGLDMARATAAKREAVYSEIFGGDNDASFSPGALVNTPASGSRSTDYMALLSPDNRRFLEAAFRRGDLYMQVKAALPARLHGALESADRGPQLLVNAGVALALQGKISLKNDTKTFGGAVNELWNVISKVLQLPSKTVYARQVLANIAAEGAARGAKSDVREQTLNPVALAITRYVNANIAPKAAAFAVDMDARMRGSGVPALTQLATLISQRTGESRADRSQSYISRKLAERNRRMNDYFRITSKWSDEHKAAIHKALLTQGAGGHVTIKGALQDITRDVAAVRGFYNEMFDYLVASGTLPAGKFTEEYFPVSIDPRRVEKRRDDFIALFSEPNIAAGARNRDLEIIRRELSRLVNEGAPRLQIDALRARLDTVRNMSDAQIAENWFMFASSKQKATQVGSTTFVDGEHDPGFKPENQRLMDFVYKLGTADQKERFAAFQDQNMDRVTVTYIDRAVRRAEWDRLDLGERITSLMNKAAQQGAPPKQLSMAKDYIDQVMGSYGTDWHPWIKRITNVFGVNLPDFDKFRALSASLITYQNLRLLPLALMSSLIDPLGVSVRDGATTRVFSAYRDAIRALRDKHGDDALRAMAEDMGIVERHAVSEALIYLYGSASDPSGVNTKINAALFRWNGLEYVTKFSRLAALSAAQRFLLAHRAGQNEDSKRYLRELGLKPSDIQLDAHGRLLRNEAVDAALTRFVDEAVVRPTPTQRPGWHNDPHFALAAQYKGYLYSFFNTVSRRALVEFENGNMRVLTPVLMYLPVTALGEMLRDMAQGDDEDRDAKAYAALAVERSGLLGPQANLLVGAKQDLSYNHSVLNSVAGPTGQQLGQAYDAANGERGVLTTAVDALPASTLFEDWFQ